jgi:regulatory protein
VLHDHPVDQVARALQLACSYLDTRERTTGEVRRYLLGEGFDAAVTEHSIASLLEEGLLDDLRFARLFITDKRELGQWGAERIRRALLQRGVEPETIAAALDMGADGNVYDDELGRALELLQRRFAAPPRSRRDRDRALGVLVRKGYLPEIALDALAAYARDS